MNCQDFEIIINDLAREQIMEAATRESAHAHIKACARCATRLADERALTSGLHALTVSTATAKAPARIEAALLTAFRERDKVVPFNLPNESTMTPAAVNAHRWRRWAIAAAASLLVMFALAASYLHVRDVPPPEQAQRVPDAHLNLIEAGPSMLLENTSLLKPKPLPIKARGSSARRPALQLGSRRVGHAAGDGNTDFDPSSNARESRTVASSGDPEIATEFLPLVDESNLRTMDGGRVVRVELPRSALISLGLPMNAERVSERVKADVLLGNDGLARAVRFVR